ncbi:MAG: sigma factor, partial [Cyanobium sp.]
LLTPSPSHPMASSPSSSPAPAPARPAAARPSTGRPGQPTRERLSRHDGSRTAAARLQWRNALVSQNLGLVHMVANRESQRCGRPYDDLCSAGYEGLIRAVESFDTSRNVALSSFAVPYIQGAMRMDQRERQQPLRTPRRLRELQQRARGLQEKRRAAGLSPLPAAELAAALGCSLQPLQAAGGRCRAACP